MRFYGIIEELGIRASGDHVYTVMCSLEKQVMANGCHHLLDRMTWEVSWLDGNPRGQWSASFKLELIDTQNNKIGINQCCICFYTPLDDKLDITECCAWQGFDWTWNEVGSGHIIEGLE